MGERPVDIIQNSRVTVFKANDIVDKIRENGYFALPKETMADFRAGVVGGDGVSLNEMTLGIVTTTEEIPAVAGRVGNEGCGIQGMPSVDFVPVSQTSLGCERDLDRKWKSRSQQGLGGEEKRKIDIQIEALNKVRDDERARVAREVLSKSLTEEQLNRLGIDLERVRNLRLVVATDSMLRH